MSDQDEQARRAFAQKTARLAAAGAAGASIAHELRNGLATASSSIYLARRDVDDRAKLLAHLDKIDREILRAQRTIEAVIALARGDAPPREPVRVEPIVELAVRSLSTQGRTVAIDIEVPAELEARCNPVLLERAVANLVTNALEALQERPAGRILVRAAGEPDGVRLVVEDDGPGIPAELGDAVFDPLTTTKALGTGIGLALCRAIAAAHGGEIAADRSSLGGARFTLFIPFR